MSPTAQRMVHLDGLRGMAVLAVVWVHFTFFTGLQPHPGSGYLGVAVFFVLSGYLITTALWNSYSCASEYSAARHYLQFLRRRVQRLYPALLALVMLGGPIFVIIDPLPIQDHLRGAATSLTQTTALAQVALGPLHGPWDPTWSLSVEWTFYVCWPLILLPALARGWTARDTAHRTAILSAVLYGSGLLLPPTAFYVLPVANLGVMLAGATLALMHIDRSDRGASANHGRDPGVVALAVLLFVVLIFLPGPGSLHAAYRYLLLPTATLIALIVIDQRPNTNGPGQRLLTSAPMRTIGQISYSIYLWHVPVLWLVWFGLPSLPAGTRTLLAALILLPIVFWSFRYLERPWLRVPSKRVSRAPEL